MRLKKAVLALFLIGIGFALYLPNIRNVLFWDDADWILNNPSVHAFTLENVKFIFTNSTLSGIGLISNYYRPVLFLSFLTNYAIGADSPIGYHIVNNLIHIANAALIFFLLDRLLRKRIVSIIASTLFLIHPLQTEAVAYVSGRGDPLSVLFMLSGLAVWIFTKRWLRWLALPLAVLAVLSRETAVLFPAYLTIFLMTFVYREGFWQSMWRSIKSSAPFFAVSLVYGILRLTALNFHNTLNFYNSANVYTEHLSYRIYTFFHVILVYLKLIAAPIGLHMERDLIVSTSLFRWPVWFAVLLLLLILIIVIRNFRANRIWFFAWAMFFVPLMPTSGVFPINALLYEHWLYFSLFGIFVLVGWYADKSWRWLRARDKNLLAFTALALFVSYGVFLGVQTVRRNIIWGKPEQLYIDILRYEPHNVRAMTNLANLYFEEGDKARARKLYEQAVNENDIQPQPYYNFAGVLIDEGDIHGAAELYKKAIEADPNFYYAYQNLASLYAQQGNFNEALKNLIILSSIRPNDPPVWYNIALVADAMKNKTLAVESIEKAEALARSNRPDLLEQIQSLKNQLSNEKPTKKQP